MATATHARSHRMPADPHARTLVTSQIAASSASDAGASYLVEGKDPSTRILPDQPPSAWELSVWFPEPRGLER
jgi:hypothetical protein